MGADSTPRHNPRPDIRKPLRISNHPFVGAKYFSPGRRPLASRNTMTISAVHHLLHGRNIFRPDIGHRWRVTACLFLPRIICGVGEIFFAPTFAIVARNTLTISALHHFWHGRNIFRPYARNCCATSNAIFQISAHVRLWAACSASAQNISPVPKMMWGRNGQGVTRHQWPTSGRKIFRPCQK